MPELCRAREERVLLFRVWGLFCRRTLLPFCTEEVLITWEGFPKPPFLTDGRNNTSSEDKNAILPVWTPIKYFTGRHIWIMPPDQLLHLARHVGRPEGQNIEIEVDHGEFPPAHILIAGQEP